MCGDYLSKLFVGLTCPGGQFEFAAQHANVENASKHMQAFICLKPLITPQFWQPSVQEKLAAC